MLFLLVGKCHWFIFEFNIFIHFITDIIIGFDVILLGCKFLLLFYVFLSMDSYIFVFVTIVEFDVILLGCKCFIFLK